jgi:hypothetical protein
MSTSKDSASTPGPGAPAAAEAPEAPDARSRDRSDERAGREPGELVVAMSPRQIIGGFALLAGLILMLRRSRRKKG